jgi:hypothetical protein
MAIPRWRLALAAGALVLLGAVGGGLVHASTTASSGAADAGAPAESTADNVVLLDSMALMSDPTSSGAAVPAQLLALRDRLQGRLAIVRRHLVHGTLTVLDRDGKLVTYQLDHGTVSAVGSASITIAEAGGSSVMVATTSETRVRKDAKASTPADLKAGDEVLVRSTVVGSSATANLIVVPPTSPAVTPPSSGNG